MSFGQHELYKMHLFNSYFIQKRETLVFFCIFQLRFERKNIFFSRQFVVVSPFLLNKKKKKKYFFVKYRLKVNTELTMDLNLNAMWKKMFFFFKSKKRIHEEFNFDSH